MKSLIVCLLVAAFCVSCAGRGNHANICHLDGQVQYWGATKESALEIARKIRAKEFESVKQMVQEKKGGFIQSRELAIVVDRDRKERLIQVVDVTGKYMMWMHDGAVICD